MRCACTRLDGTPVFSRLGCRDTPDGGLGWSVASLGDLNGDGLGELVFGSPFESWFPQINQGAVRVIGGTCCPSAWLNYGDGWPGTFGVPELLLRDDPDLCTEVNVVVGNSSRADSVGLILIGAIEADTPTALDGTIWLRPLVTTVVPLRARGDRLTLSVPCDPAARGAVALAQCLQLDAGASKGVAFSRGLKAVLGD
ncbi:MAG: integrin alpha [Planctomycetota bacterium]